MAVRSSVVTVTTEPAVLIDESDIDIDQNRRDVAIQNTGSVTVYLGGEGVTIDGGFPLAAGQGLTLEAVHPDSLPHGIVASGTGSVAVLEVGV